MSTLSAKNTTSKAKIPFVKMHGIGNDFVVLDNIRAALTDDFDFASAARVLCARHLGIGSDGLLLLDKSQVADARMRMWNPDGSEDMCGNGLRCIALLAHARGHVRKKHFAVETLAGVRACEIIDEVLVRVEMGEPEFAFSAIPMLPLITQQEAIEYSLPVGDVWISSATSLSTGSTHTVIFVDELPEDEEFFALSPAIENHQWFPERTSVLWTKVEKNQASVRIWERGVGETLACGTGACAVAVAAKMSGRANTPLRVQSKGGALEIEWCAGQTIHMTGPARIVFEGVCSF